IPKKTKLAASGLVRRNSSIADCCDLKYSSRRYWPRSSAKNAAIRPRSRAATSSRRRDMVRTASGCARESARPGARPHGLFHFVTWTGSDALAIGERGRRACGPDGVEPGHPCVVVVANGHGFDDSRPEPRAVERLRRGRARDAGREAEMRVAEIRHSGRSVVDDERGSAGRGEVLHYRQAGMRAREYVDGGPREQRLRALGTLAQRLLREPPAGEGFGVAVNDADPQVPDLRDKVHGQDGEALAQFRIRARGPAQAPENLVRALHFGVAHPFRVGAAAARAGIRATDFGFHVAPQGHVLQDGLIDAFEFRRIYVEPVEIAVEDERRAFPPRHGKDRFERERIAVKPPDDVERPCLEVRGPREDRGRVAVVARTGPAGRSSH